MECDRETRVRERVSWCIWELNFSPLLISFSLSPSVFFATQDSLPTVTSLFVILSSFFVSLISRTLHFTLHIFPTFLNSGTISFYKKIFSFCIRVINSEKYVQFFIRGVVSGYNKVRRKLKVINFIPFVLGFFFVFLFFLRKQY